MQNDNCCPCCGRHCDLSEPRCWRGEEYARTGQIPESGGHEGRGHEGRGREGFGREGRGHEGRGHGAHDHRDGCRRPDKPRKSILDSKRYETMDMEEKLTALLRETGNWIRFHMEDKGSQNRILRILAEEGPMTQKALTERIGIQPGSASEVLGKLEKSGLITRTTSEADRRTVDVTLTETGKEQALQQSQIIKERKAAMFAVLPAEEKQVLLTALETLSRDWKSREKQNADNQNDRQPQS